MRRKRRARPKQDRKLTQEELLEEAKWTELDNLATLEAYARMEAEKKKVKVKKVVWSGPVVRYMSLTMPVVAENDDTALSVGLVKRGDKDDPSVKKGESSVKDTHDGHMVSSAASSENVSTMETDASSNNNPESASPRGSATPTSPGGTTPTPPNPSSQKQSRNFMVFTDTNNFPSAYFPPNTRPPRPRRRFCPVTGLPAKYIDPLTHTPYATPFAFKVIRMRYVSDAEEKCEKRLIQLSSWLEEKKKRRKLESV